MPRDQLIQVRRDTAANWTSRNPTLSAGELGLETDTGKIKGGDGSTAWTSLSYAGGAMTAAQILAALLTVDGAGSGLDADLLDGSSSAAFVQAALVDAKGDLVTATAADTPARLAVGTDGHVLTADSGQTTGIKWAAAAGGSVATDAIFDAAGDLAVGTGANTSAKHTVGSNGQILTVDTAQSDKVAWVDGPWHVSVPITLAPTSKVGTWDLYRGDTVYYTQLYNSTTAQNDEINWKLWLTAGTWTMWVTYDKQTNCGINAVTLGGTSIATIDGYNGSTTHQNISKTTGIAVASTGVYTLRFLISTKNASSSNYTWLINAIDFTRTA